ncbi:MAG: Uma2 family endonuclease [Chloroflexota bacterium]|nr:Uma2 family endonuclease [Chloroflexota bacterium]
MSRTAVGQGIDVSTERIPLVLPHKTMPKNVTRPVIETRYPEADGEPMAETDVHRDLMTDALLHPLKERFRQESDVYVSGNLFLYYEKGNPSAVVAPDVFVVFGVSNQQRRTYKLWEESKAPDVVFELTSGSTYREDLSDKRLVYEMLGVREYFLFDPLRDYLRPPLQGFRLNEFYYVSVMPEPWSEGEWQIHSQVLGLTVRTDGPTLRLYDPEQDRYLFSRPEEAQARRLAEARATTAETEIARLQAILARQESQN